MSPLLLLDTIRIVLKQDLKAGDAAIHSFPLEIDFNLTLIFRGEVKLLKSLWLCSDNNNSVRQPFRNLAFV